MTPVRALMLSVFLMGSGNQDAPAAVRHIDWDWGELRFDRRYVGHLTIRNDCATEQRVLIVSDRVPYLTIQRTATLRPRASVDVPYLITPTRRTPETLSDTVSGEVVIWHSRDAASDCAAVAVVHVVTGRVRIARFEDAGPEGATAQKAAIWAACSTWWIGGESPVGTLARATLPDIVRRPIAGLDQAQCAAVIRPEARRFRQRLIDERPTRDRDAWAWLPDDAAIDRMSMTELAALRRRVNEQRKKPG